MPQSLANMLVHLVFSTKNRQRLLTPDIATALYPYFGGALRAHNCQVLQTGGVEDHVHILFQLSRTLCLAEAVNQIKGSSSKWIKDHFGVSNFGWQNGYGAFSLAAHDIETVRRYIQRQAEHHAEDSYQDEFRRMLREARMEWDERYVWD